MIALLPLLLALQQPIRGQSTTPTDGDTAGYWQQRVSYRIAATLDERAGHLRADGELWYVNNSPTPLSELYLHQHLNAFRPHSAWSRADAAEGRNRFQELRDPDHGYERFTRAPVAEGTALTVTYPYAPDSTVVRVRLPRALATGDSIRIEMAWEARPATVPRRQGRRGRHWDFAHWYPRVAVYDRRGWQHNPLVPAGEFYGEFGTYDVTLVVADDQVLGATGVPTGGDPGWSRARRQADPVYQARAYDRAPADLPPAPPGHRAVRWRAENVHHFAWSASPDYRYEGAAWVRRVDEPLRFRTWDTVAVHVLYRPGDEATWGNGIAVQRTIEALEFLERTFGPYGYPQVTNLHRLDGGGTEFPMMMMNGSPSAGLILHELAHIYAHGMLANNEWRSGWMDEGLASYVTSMAQGTTAQDRARMRAPGRAPTRASTAGYRRNARALAPDDATGLAALRLELAGRTQPIGTVSHEFSEFGIYNAMTYDRASEMYGALRDVMGEVNFRRFLQDYYRTWAFRHVDELAMRIAAERASRQQLTWFFDQWLRDTGLLDYSIEDQLTVERADGTFATRVAVLRRGRFAHPMPIGARTDTGWVIVRAEPWARRQVVEIVTTAHPHEVRIDPLHVTTDWDRRNDVWALPIIGRNTIVFDWPFLRQMDRERNILALFPQAWYSAPGGLTLGARARGHYLDLIDRREFGVAVAMREPPMIPAADGRLTGSPPASQVQLWARLENPSLPLTPRPLMGHALGIAMLDGVAVADYSRTWDISRLHVARGPRVEVTAGALTAYPFDRNFLPPSWQEADIAELHLLGRGRLPLGRVPVVGSPPLDTLRLRGAAYGGYLGPERAVAGDRAYGRVEAEAVRIRYARDTATAFVARGFAGWNWGTPPQRTLGASARDGLETFSQHWYRPRDAVFRQRSVHYVPLGGAGIRAAGPDVLLAGALAANVEVARRLLRLPPSLGTVSLWASAFGDIAFAQPMHATAFDRGALGDAGFGASLRGRLFDRDVRVRLDLPIVATHPALTREGGETLAPRYLFAFEDWW